MAQPILVPQVGQDLTEAKVVELHVKLGDRVKKGDLVAVVESEKASFEVEAFAEGTVLELRYQEGDTAEVLAPLMILGEPGEAAAPAPAPSPGPSPAAAVAEAVAAVAEPVQAAVASVAQAAGRIASQIAGQVMGEPAEPAEPVGAGRLRSSPLARRVAALRGIDLSALRGTGPKGAVVLRDVESWAEPPRANGALAPSPAPASSAGPLELRTLQAGQGTPLVFLHGFGADLSAWRPLLGGLGLGSPMLALDLPGHGASLGRSASSFADLVEAVGRSLASLGGLHLVGHSLGAAVAAALTERGDLDIRSLTLLAPAGLSARIDGDFVEGFLGARSEAALRTWMRRLVHDQARLTPTLVRATLASREGKPLAEGQSAIARAVFEGSTQLFSVRDALARYDGPLTVIAGREDAVIPLREVEAQVPGHAALHRLAGVGHMPQVEAAELVQRLIARTVRAAG